MTIFEVWLIHAVIGVVAMVVKNPQKKQELCALLISLRDSITEAYPNGCSQ